MTTPSEPPRGAPIFTHDPDPALCELHLLPGGSIGCWTDHPCATVARIWEDLRPDGGPTLRLIPLPAP